MDGLSRCALDGLCLLTPVAYVVYVILHSYTILEFSIQAQSGPSFASIAIFGLNVLQFLVSNFCVHSVLKTKEFFPTSES